MKTVDDASRFLIAERLGKVQSVTPEGYLLCEAVPVARTGLMLYAEGELIGEDGKAVLGGKDGIIRVLRSPKELFRPETISSFNGKPITDGHPAGMADPDNWAQCAKGTMLNVRRGAGVEDDLLLADLLITDSDAIQLVRDGKREVSLGYDADYPQDKPGEARQTNIIGNHIALTDNGRCGPRCSIGDDNMATAPKKFSWKTIARAAFKTKDEAAFEEAMKEADAEGEESGKAGGVVVHVHNAPAEAKESPKAKATDEDGGADAGATADPLQAILDAIKKIDERLSAVEQGVAKNAEAEAAETETGDEDGSKKKDGADDKKFETTDEDEPLEIAGEAEKKEDKKDEKKGTTDSANRRAEILDVKARAEILVPGVKFPTFDAKDAKVSDTICAFRRRVLKHAMTTDSGAKIIKPMLPANADPKTMTCDAVNMTFHAASEAVKAHNNGANRSVQSFDSPAAKTTVAVADINKSAEEFWSKH